MGKVDEIEYKNIENLTWEQWLKSGELEINNSLNLVPHRATRLVRLG